MDLLVYAKERGDMRQYGGSGEGVQVFTMDELEYVKRKKLNLEVPTCMECPFSLWGLL